MEEALAKEVRSLDESKFLDFEKVKTQPITLDQLKRTHVENDVKGNPLMGMYHFMLFETIIQMAQEYNYGVEVYDMFAAQNRDRYQQGVVLNPQVEGIYGERAVEAYTLRRVFANAYRLASARWFVFATTSVCSRPSCMLPHMLNVDEAQRVSNSPTSSRLSARGSVMPSVSSRSNAPR